MQSAPVFHSNNAQDTRSATGQDAANIAGSQAAIVYSDLQENGDLYWSITLPSVIVASYVGGTGLGKPREIV